MDITASECANKSGVSFKFQGGWDRWICRDPKKITNKKAASVGKCWIWVLDPALFLE
jgi:hypothetical protein